MTWLVTGGAGYLGAHVVHRFLEAGIPVTVLDDLSTGQRSFIPAKVSFTRGTILDGALLERVMAEHDVTGVVHVAGSSDEAGSVSRPLHAFEQNVDGTSVVLAAMQDRGVNRIVYVSSVAVYGPAEAHVLTEDLAPAPGTPFAQTKLVAEWMLQDQAVAAGLNHTSLRIPEVLGSVDATIFDPRRHAPLAAVFASLDAGEVPALDPNVRDYVHADDVALAILAAATRMDAGTPHEPVYNLGTGAGVSGAELLAAVRRVTGMTVATDGATTEPGVAHAVASGELAARDLGWESRHSLDAMVASSWAASQAARSATAR